MIPPDDPVTFHTLRNVSAGRASSGLVRLRVWDPDSDSEPAPGRWLDVTLTNEAAEALALQLLGASGPHSAPRVPGMADALLVAKLARTLGQIDQAAVRGRVDVVTRGEIIHAPTAVLLDVLARIERYAADALGEKWRERVVGRG